MKKIIVITFLLFQVLPQFAQVRSYGRQQMDLWVAPEWGKLDAASGGGRAIMVKSYQDARYVPVDSIEGFTYEPGYEYHILVKYKKIPAPEGQTKAVSRYVLVKVAEKTKAGEVKPSPVEDRS